MAKKRKQPDGAAESEGKPVDMTGFALLQIIAWTNGVIAGVKEKLETEKSSGVLAHLQGEIPGCKFTLQTLREHFQLNDDFMANGQICDYASLSFEELLGAQKDIEKLEGLEPWAQFLAKIDERVSAMKEFLLFSAKKSRDLYFSQGRYEGMTAYKEVFKQVAEAINYRRNMEPLFHQEPGTAEQEAGDSGTALVPSAGTGVAVRDRDLPPDEDDDSDTDDEEDSDFSDFPAEGDPDLE
jgi:hypothetical protein